MPLGRSGRRPQYAHHPPVEVEVLAGHAPDVFRVHLLDAFDVMAAEVGVSGQQQVVGKLLGAPLHGFAGEYQFSLLLLLGPPQLRCAHFLVLEAVELLDNAGLGALQVGRVQDRADDEAAGRVVRRVRPCPDAVHQPLVVAQLPHQLLKI